ncbi:hypothetical protein KM043_001669 [Ampulex compressa]|nr:hypothetical protein KM043_001669 [Ampulex compressa]
MARGGKHRGLSACSPESRNSPSHPSFPRDSRSLAGQSSRLASDRKPELDPVTGGTRVESWMTFFAFSSGSKGREVEAGENEGIDDLRKSGARAIIVGGSGVIRRDQRGQDRANVAESAKKPGRSTRVTEG